MSECVHPEDAMEIFFDVLSDPETSVVYWNAVSGRGGTLGNSFVFDEKFNSDQNKALVAAAILDGIEREHEFKGADIDVGEFVQECVDEASERVGTVGVIGDE